MDFFEHRESLTPLRWRIPAAVLVGASVLLLLVAGIEDSRGDQVLGFLSPVMQGLMAGGQWIVLLLWHHPVFAGLTVFGLCVMMAAAHLWRGRRSAVPVGFLLVALGFAALAQGLIKADRIRLSVLLYGISFVLAMIAGLWPKKKRHPAEDSTGDGPPPPIQSNGGPETESSQTSAMSGARLEIATVTAISLLALTCRLYALNQIPAVFDDETVGAMIMSTSITGMRDFMLNGPFLGNSLGAYHVVLMYVLHKVFGASLLMIRLTAALPGAVAVPLFYGFLRSLKGKHAALFGSAILGFSVLQLFISRTDFNYFIHVPLLGIVMAWLSWKAIKTCRLGYYFLLLLAMPASRFVYTPGNLAWLIPIGLFCHQAIFRRGFLRKAWPGIFFLAAGAALWVFSVTLVIGAIKGSVEWIHPIRTYGAAAWQRAGVDASRSQQVQTTLNLMGKNVLIMAEGIFHEVRNPTHFFQSWRPGDSRGAYVIASAAALLIPALGLLLSRFKDPRAFLILVWIFFALIPGCLSVEASERRTAMLFPAIYAAAAIFIAAIVEQSRRTGGKCLGSITLGLFILGLLATGLAGLNGVFRVRTKTPDRIVQARFIGDLMEESDLIVHDCAYRGGMGIELFNIDRLMDESKSAFIQYEPEAAWPLVALRPGFRGDSDVYRITQTGERARARYAQIKPRSYAFVLTASERNERKFALLEQLYPNAKTLSLDFADPRARLRAFQIPGEAPQLLVSLEARWGNAENARELFETLLPYIPYVIETEGGEEEATVRGGLLVQDFGWYAFDWKQSGDSPRLVVDDRKTERDTPIPLTTGAHSFSVTVMDPHHHRSALDLQWRRIPERRFSPITADLLVEPNVTSLGAIRPEPITLYEGHPGKTQLAQGVKGIHDMAYDDSGILTAVCNDFGRWMIRRFDSSGNKIAEWHADVGYQPHGLMMSIARNGTVTLVGNRDIFSFTLDGQPQGRWETGTAAPASDGEYDDQGNLWVCYSRRHQVVCYGPDRKPLREFGSYGKGQGQFILPSSAVFTGERELYIADSTGRIQVFQLGESPQDIVFKREFQVRYSALPFEGRCFAVDSKGWLYYPEQQTRRTLVYDREGNRRVALKPAEDLNGMDIKAPWLIEAGGGYLFVYDRANHTIWRIPEGSS